MAFPKIASVSSLSLAGVVLLVGGLGISIVASQQQQETRSRAYLESGGGGSNPLPGAGTIRKISCSRNTLEICDASGGNCNGVYPMPADIRNAHCISSKYYFSVNCSDPSTHTFCSDESNPSACINNETRSGAFTDVCSYVYTQRDAGTNYDPNPDVTDADFRYLCTQAKGTCSSTSTCTSSQGTMQGYCTAAKTSACCVPPPSTNIGVTTPSQCGSAGCCANSFPGAKCQYTSNACPGGYETNYCGGGNDYKCCKSAATTTKPAPPTNVTGSCSGTDLTVKWTPVSGYSNYFVFIRDETNNQTLTSSGTSPVTGSDFTFHNLTSGHEYSYWMNTTTASGNPSSDPAPAPFTAKTTCGGSSSGGTIFNLNLLLHGIGKGGDNRNPNGGGNPGPKNQKRDVVVTVNNLDGQAIIENKVGEVTFDSAFGGYKGQIDVGTILQSQAYVIRVKLMHSLWGSISRNVTAGTTNDIPVIKLVNGDANNDGLNDILDYNIIIGCYADPEFGINAADCNDDKKKQANIDDDNDVNQFDLNLFLREMSVQQ